MCIFSDGYSDQSEECQNKCLLESFGLFDGINGFNVDHIVEIEMHDGVDENVAKSIAYKCAVKKNEFESNCMWASRGYDCLQAQVNNCFSNFDSVSYFQNFQFNGF